MSAPTNPAAPRGMAVLLTVAVVGLILVAGGCSSDTSDPASAPSTSAASEPPATAEPTKAPEPTKTPITVNPDRPDVPGAYTRSTLDAWAKAFKQAPRDLKQILKKNPKIPTSQGVALEAKQPVWSAIRTDPNAGTNYMLFGLQSNFNDGYNFGEDENMVVKADLNTGEALQGPKVFAEIQRRAQQLK